MMARVVERAHSPDVLIVLSDSSLSSAGSSFRELDDVFLQTQARIWLGEVLHTRLDEETAIADLLADGKLLFQVSRVIIRMLLTKCMELRYTKAYIYEPKISGKGSGRYMPYSNVDLFLKICQILGLTGVDLFSPSDVVEKRDIRRVCMCIRALSKKARSKHLTVPDFDIVTYTIAMPTDMVGCIRRSLERSLHSASSSSSSNPSINSRLRYRQIQNEDYGMSYDASSDESDDAESDRRIFGFQSPDTKPSNATALVPDLEELLGVSEVEKNCFLTKAVLLLDAEDQEVDGHNGQYDCVMASTGSPNIHHQRVVNPEFVNTHMHATSNHPCVEPSNDLNAREFYINRKEVWHHMCTPENNSVSFCHVRTPASVVVDSMETKTSEGRYPGWWSDILELNGNSTCSCDYVWSDEEGKGRISMIDNGSSSHHRAPSDELGRRLYDEMEDAEVSSMASLGSASSQAITVDYENGFGAELDFTDEKIDSFKFENLEIDQTDKRYISGLKFYDTVKCQNPEDIVALQGNMKFVNNMNSRYAFQPAADWTRFFTIGGQNHARAHDSGIMYDRDSAVAQAHDKVLHNSNATLNSENISSDVNWNQLEEVLRSQSDSPCSIQAIWSEKDHCLTAMVSKGNNDAAPSGPAVPLGLYPNFFRCSPTIASGDALQLDSSTSLGVVDTDKISIASKKGADTDTRKLLKISLSKTSEASGAIYGLSRNELFLEVLEVQNCCKYSFVRNNLYCSLKQMHQLGVACKNTLEEKIVLNRFSTLTGGEEWEPTSLSSLDTACFLQVNPSGIFFGENNVWNDRNSINTAVCCYRNSLFDINTTSDLMIHQQNSDGDLDKHIEAACCEAQSAESDTHRLKTERLSSAVKVGNAYSRFSDVLGIRNIGYQETQTSIRALVENHAVHTREVPVSQSVPSIEYQPYSSVTYLEETWKEENSENILQTMSQVAHGSCIECEKEADYCSKQMDEDKGKHENLNSRTVESPKVKRGKQGRNLLLRSIGGGFALFGGILLYLHFRRKGGIGKLGETSVSSTQTLITNFPGLSTRKTRKRDGTNKVYPGDRLSFQE